MGAAIVGAEIGIWNVKGCAAGAATVSSSIGVVMRENDADAFAVGIATVGAAVGICTIGITAFCCTAEAVGAGIVNVVYDTGATEAALP